MSAPTENSTFVELIQGSTVKPVNICWLWNQWLALGKLHLLAGEPGTNKTTTALAWAATITTAGIWPDGSRCAKPQNVIIWSNEDDVNDTLTPRLIANGANMDRVFFVSGMNSKGKRYAFDPSKHLPLLQQAIAKLGNVGLVVIDSAANLVNGDSHKNNEVRKSLQPLVDMANEFNFVALGIVHFNKGNNDSNPLSKIVGSVGFGGMTRVAFASAIDPSDPDKRLLVRIKNNLGKSGDGFRYGISINPLQNYPDISAPCIQWLEKLEGTAKELLGFDPEQGDKQGGSKVREAEDFLMSTLANGMMQSEEVFRIANEKGISEKTIKRAKDKLGILSGRPDGAVKWYYILPTPPTKN
mgnify:FL=1